MSTQLFLKTGVVPLFERLVLQKPADSLRSEIHQSLSEQAMALLLAEEDGPHAFAECPTTNSMRSAVHIMRRLFHKIPSHP